MNSFSSKIAFVSAFVTAVTLAVVFKLCLVFTCQSLVYANAMLSTSFTLLVCLKMYEMQQQEELQPPTDKKQPTDEPVDTSFVEKLTVVKNIQLSYVLPCIKTVINDMYETFGWCVEPVFWLFEKYMQAVYPFDNSAHTNRIEIVNTFCVNLSNVINNNPDINDFVKQLIDKFCKNIISHETKNPHLSQVSVVLYALDELNAELTNILQKSETQVEEHLEAQVEEHLEAQVEEHLEAQVEEQPETQVDEQPETQVDEQPETQVDEQLEAQVEEQPDAQVEEQLNQNITETISDDSIDYNLAQEK